MIKGNSSMCEEKYEKQVSLRTRHCSESFKEKLGKLPKDEWRKILDSAEEFVISAVDNKLNNNDDESDNKNSDDYKKSKTTACCNPVQLLMMFTSFINVYDSLTVAEYERFEKVSFNTVYRDCSENDLIFKLSKLSDSHLIHVSISTPRMGQGSEIPFLEFSEVMNDIIETYSLSYENLEAILMILSKFVGSFKELS